MTRRSVCALLAGLPLARSQSFLPGLPNLGVKADTGPARSESGVGALLPWADVLWAVTYNSHKAATGSGLGLYMIDDRLQIRLVHRSDGTHANRYVHTQSQQAIIGPYVIDLRGNFRVIESLLDHRLTATMAHLTDPANRVCMLTMEGLLFEMDVASLKTRLLFDLNKEFGIERPHFKGGCTAQDRLVVANNGFYAYGETQAGLFEFDGKRWRALSRKPHMECAARRNLGQIIYCTGWDEASVLFWALIQGRWRRYRLPKASHTFDHAWQTEWTRIREVETERFLVDMHGMFYELQPVAFEDSIWGLKPICQHLRIVPDFCSFRGLFVMAGNQNTPNADNNPVGGQPQAGIWFGKTDDLWSFGPPQGWGGPWRNTEVRPDEPSDPFLFTGFAHKVLHLKTDRATEIRIEVDFLGNGAWELYETLKVSEYRYHVFPAGFSAHWVRLVPASPCVATAQFIFT
ncbi:MAG: hypothetical protein ACP5U2_00455 [Bryobacteraceae bacterium]